MNVCLFRPVFALFRAEEHIRLTIYLFKIIWHFQNVTLQVFVNFEKTAAAAAAFEKQHSQCYKQTPLIPYFNWLQIL